ncbi:jg27885, partial [Pararge aegeria aegeria]
SDGPRSRQPRVDVSYFPSDIIEPWRSTHGELSGSPHSPGDAVTTPQVVIGKCPSKNRNLIHFCLVRGSDCAKIRPRSLSLSVVKQANHKTNAAV